MLPPDSVGGRALTLESPDPLGEVSMVSPFSPSLEPRSLRGPPLGGQPFGPWCSFSPRGHLVHPGRGLPVRGPNLAGLPTGAPTPRFRSGVPGRSPASWGARSLRLVPHLHLSPSSCLVALLGIGTARGTARPDLPLPFARSLPAARALVPDLGPLAAGGAVLPGGAPDLGFIAAWGAALPGSALLSVPAALVPARGLAAGRWAASPRRVSSPSPGTGRTLLPSSGSARCGFHRDGEGGPILSRPPPGAALACALPAPVSPARCLRRPVGS